MILDRTATIYRLLPDPNDADNEYYQPVIYNVRVNIQPESPEYQAAAGDTFGRTYRGYTTQSGILINDKIAVSGTVTISGKSYVIRGVADWNFPPLPHFQISLTEAGQ